MATGRFASEALQIEPADAHVWFASMGALARSATALGATLGPEEIARLKAYHRPRDRERFAIRRGLLRVLLASYRGERPERIEFDERCPYCHGLHGKPRLTAGSGRFSCFSVSASGDLIAYALSNCDVGIDLERVDSRVAWRDISREFFSTRENASIVSLDVAEQASAFFRAWTRKEAFAKAVGHGHSLPLSSVEVSIDPGPDARLCSVPVDASAQPPWSPVDVSPRHGYEAALVVRAHALRTPVTRWVDLRL